MRFGIILSIVATLSAAGAIPAPLKDAASMKRSVDNARALKSRDLVESLKTLAASVEAIQDEDYPHGEWYSKREEGHIADSLKTLAASVETIQEEDYEIWDE